MRQLNNAADPFAAIGDPSRRAMLHLLSGGNMSINTLAENFDMSRPAVSKHVKILYNAGFITIEDVGRERRCTLSRQGFEDLQKWIDFYDGFWSAKMKKLDGLLQAHTSKKIKNSKDGKHNRAK
jgi:DNA-binding transcriptional ArsR family regulator